MPSPRTPRPLMARRSIKLCPDEEFEVAVAAGNRGRKAYDIAAAERCGVGCDLSDDCLMDGRIAHDSFLDMGARCFELRLYQGEDMRGPGRNREGGGQHQLEGNEAHVDGHEIGLFGEPPGIEGADVGLLQRHDLRLAAQMRMKLAGADVDRVDAPRAAGEKHLRKSAG